MADPSLLARGVHHAVDDDATPGMLIRMADNIRFTLNGAPVEVIGLSPMTTLLDWLRDHCGLRGTKEGCAEGDCGACTVVLEHADGKREAMNSCIALLGQMDGQSVRTVEGLLGKDGAPHPIQVAMAEADATQCGFSTTRWPAIYAAAPAIARSSRRWARSPAWRSSPHRRHPSAARPPASTALSLRHARSPNSWRCAPSIPRRCCWPAPPTSACWPAARASRPRP